MCASYTPATPRHLLAMPGLESLALPAQSWPAETFPGHAAPIIVSARRHGSGEAGALVCELARYGLVPRWCKDSQQAATLSRHTYNARSETVAEKPSYRAPWREGRLALAPMLSFFEPCWETGRSVRWRIAMASGEPFAAAGLHEHWTDPASGERVRSFTLLTVNADGHPLLGRMHRPGNEKRRVVIVPSGAYVQWLQASPAQAMQMMRSTPVELLAGEPAPLRAQPQQSLGF